MDVKELRQLSGDELAEKAKQLGQELFNLRFQMGTGRLENPMQIRKTKRYRAGKNGACAKFIAGHEQAS